MVRFLFVHFWTASPPPQVPGGIRRLWTFVFEHIWIRASRGGDEGWEAPDAQLQHQPLQLPPGSCGRKLKVWTTWVRVGDTSATDDTRRCRGRRPLALLFTFYPSQHHDLIHSNEVTQLPKSSGHAALFWHCVGLPEREGTLSAFQERSPRSFDHVSFRAASSLHPHLGQAEPCAVSIVRWGPAQGCPPARLTYRRLKDTAGGHMSLFTNSGWRPTAARVWILRPPYPSVRATWVGSTRG